MTILDIERNHTTPPAPFSLHVKEGFAVQGRQIEPGDVIIIDPALSWTSGRVHLFEHGAATLLEQVSTEGPEAAWTDATGTRRHAPIASLRLLGVALGRWPDFKPW